MPSSARPGVTIAQIADEAGVSTPTVSRVLNGRADVSPRTRRRVEDLLRAHGYQRRGTQARAGLLDLVFNDLDSPWAVEILRGVQGAALTAGLGTVVSAVHDDAAGRRVWLENVRARASDGAVLVTTALDEHLRAELDELAVPVVVVDPAGVPDLDVPTVGATNWAGGHAATAHLTGLGHRRIGYVAGPQELVCARARLGGHRAALEEADADADRSLVVPGSFDYLSGSRAGGLLLDRERPPTAVVAASDHMALGVVEAARRRGLRVPEDLSVVGFDDLPEASWAAPPLTTVRQPMAEMGRLAVRTLQQLLAGEAVAARVELATELVVRQSTTAPRL